MSQEIRGNVRVSMSIEGTARSGTSPLKRKELMSLVPGHEILTDYVRLPTFV